MKPSRTLMIAAATLALLVGNAFAEQKGRVSYDVSTKDTTYTHELNLNADDAPNHIVRAYEFRRLFPSNAPVLNGIEVAEEWERGLADRTSGNGTSKLYKTLIMKNGDKIFAEATAVVVPNSSTGRTDGTYVGKITRGTGKFTGVTGFLRGASSFDLKGYNAGNTEWDYSISE